MDKASIDAATFQVTGAGGPVDGELNVDGSRVTFTASAPWTLLAEYTVTLGAGIRSVENVALEEGATFSFRVRDGSLGKASRIFDAPSTNLKHQGSPTGHVVLSWNQKADASAHHVAFFNALTKQWKVTPFTATHVSSCLNDQAEAFVLARGTSTVWSRLTDGEWTKPGPAGLAAPAPCALANHGLAMTLRDDGAGEDVQPVAQPFSAENALLAPVSLRANSRAWGVIPYQDGFLAFIDSGADERVFSRTYQGGAWAAAKPITPAAEPVNYVSYSARSDAAVFTWKNADSNVSAAVFDGASWATTELAPTFEATSSCAGATRHIAAWYNQGSTYAAFFEGGKGWGEPTKLGSTTGTWLGPAVAVDDLGNALAAWVNDGEIGWKRFSHATREWGPTEIIEDQDPASVMVTASATTGEVTLVWSNELGVWASRFE